MVSYLVHVSHDTKTKCSGVHEHIASIQCPLKPLRIGSKLTKNYRFGTEDIFMASGSILITSVPNESRLAVPPRCTKKVDTTRE